MNWNIFFITLGRVFVLQTILASNAAVQDSNGKFSLKLSTAIGLNEPMQNVIISPLLVQSALTLLYYGSSDDTATLLKRSLNLANFANKQTATTSVAELLSSTKLKAKNQIHLANAIYIQEKLTFNYKDDFKNTAQQFDTTLERVNFGKDSNALDKINYHFLTKTNFTIGEMLNKTNLNDNSQFVSLSAASFRSPWAKAFDIKETEKINFHSSKITHRLIDCMFIADQFKYADFSHLKAKGIEIPFQAPDLNMFILYPDDIDGLSVLEEKLQREDFFDLARQLSEQKVALTLPKFRAEFNADLTKTLSHLGMSEIFSSSANFQNMFSSLFTALTPAVSKIQHKAVLEIDETGDQVEKGGFSFSNLFKRQIQLVINHPFFFVIKTQNAVLLSGHIVNL